MNVFDNLAPYIQEYIYKNKWNELRDVQVASCEVIFNTANNLLLSSGTASGKTEAAFLPTLTELYTHPAKSVGILYISPLKALINDQFYRLDGLLEESNISVCKWHGDVSQSIKNKVLKNPQGVLQTTPESLESMLINGQDRCGILFNDLKFVIIDEVHYFMDNDRGLQLLSIFERMNRLLKINPRRIGLSATLGDYSLAKTWINSGTGRDCSVPIINGQKRVLRLSMDAFTFSDYKENYIQESINHIYKNTVGKKSIIFTNSKSDAEFYISKLKELALKRGEDDIYRIHHGNVSASIREDTEKEMKHADYPIATAATLTLELGIDIGALDRVIQLGSPTSASSFVQRLGRCGRRGGPSEMLFCFLEDEVDTTRIETMINWEFVKCVAIIQLYLEEKWIEPMICSKLPYNILYHQTMSYLTSIGEVSPNVLAQNMLTLSPFKNITQDDFKSLLKQLLDIKHIQRSENGGLMIGECGEKIVNHYDFYSVFESSIDYTVKYKTKTIGTINYEFPVGGQFSLAGQTWKVETIVKNNNTIFVEKVAGTATIKFNFDSMILIHEKIMKKILEVISGNQNYQYLSENFQKRLAEIRTLAETSGLTNNMIVPISNNQYLILPWLGTKEIIAMSLILNSKGIKNSVNGVILNAALNVEYHGDIKDLQDIINSIKTETIDKSSLLVDDEVLVKGKFNKFIPKELLTKQYLEDFIDIESLKKNL